MILVHSGLTGAMVAPWRSLRKNGQVFMRTSHSLLRNQRHRATVGPARIRANGNFSNANLELLHELYLIWTVCEMCDEPKWRCWPGVVPGWLYVCIAQMMQKCQRMENWFEPYCYEELHSCKFWKIKRLGECVPPIKCAWLQNNLF